MEKAHPKLSCYSSKAPPPGTWPLDQRKGPGQSPQHRHASSLFVPQLRALGLGPTPSQHLAGRSGRPASPCPGEDGNFPLELLPGSDVHCQCLGPTAPESLWWRLPTTACRVPSEKRLENSRSRQCANGLPSTIHQKELARKRFSKCSQTDSRAILPALSCLSFLLFFVLLQLFDQHVIPKLPITPNWQNPVCYWTVLAEVCTVLWAGDVAVDEDWHSDHSHLWP